MRFIIPQREWGRFSTGVLSSFGMWEQSCQSLDTSYLSEKGRISILLFSMHCVGQPLACVSPARRSYIGNYQADGQMAPQSSTNFIEIMVALFVNLTQNAAGRYLREKSSMINDHKIALLKKKYKNASSYREEEFFRLALWVAVWRARITVYLNLFQECFAPSPMPISLKSILCLPGFHLSGHLTK